MACEHAAERRIVERKTVEDVGTDEVALRHSLARELEHPFALVDAGDFSAQVSSQKAGPTGDVQRLDWRKSGDGTLERAHIVVPVRSI